MKRKIVTLLGVAALSCAIMTGCGSKDAQTEAPAQETEEPAEADTTKADAAEETKEADTEEAVSIKADENSGVAWFTPEEALQKSTEPWFVERVYGKLIEKVKRI